MFLSRVLWSDYPAVTCCGLALISAGMFALLASTSQQSNSDLAVNQ